MIRFSNVISSNYIGKSAIFDAPKDGTVYGRQNGAWAEAAGGGPPQTVDTTWSGGPFTYEVIDWTSGSRVSLNPDPAFTMWFDLVNSPVNPDDVVAVWMQLVIDVEAINTAQTELIRSTIFVDRLHFSTDPDPVNGGRSYEGNRSYIGDSFLAENSLIFRAKFDNTPQDAGRLYATLQFGPSDGVANFYWNAKLFLKRTTSPF